jgi:hypothetical protein
MNMKRLFFVSAFAFCAVTSFAQVDSTTEAVTPDSSTSPNKPSQSATQSDISDEDLRKYAVTMDSVNGMKQTLLDEIANKVRNNIKIPVSRYNELYKIIGDEAKLAEAKATPEEIAFVKEVTAFKDQGAAKINEKFQALAKDYVGVSKFNKIKNSLATDNELKARYDAIFGEVESSGSASAK